MSNNPNLGREWLFLMPVAMMALMFIGYFIELIQYAHCTTKIIGIVAWQILTD